MKAFQIIGSLEKCPMCEKYTQWKLLYKSSILRSTISLDWSLFGGRCYEYLLLYNIVEVWLQTYDNSILLLLFLAVIAL